MPRGDKIMFKYRGDGSEFHNGIPAQDILESDLEAMTDDQIATLGASALYGARNDADEVAAKAEKRVEKEAAAAAAPPEAVSVTVAEAPKAESKK